jgi:hypothetical protein
MNQLTQEQIKTLEDAFASYPDDYKRTHKYATMEGIQEQLKSPTVDSKGNKFIVYISKVRSNKEINEHGFTMESMMVEETK